MKELSLQIKGVDWKKVSADLHDHGFAVIDRFFTEDQCEYLCNLYDQNSIFRKTVIMERYRFGLGEYKYFDYPLPEILRVIREGVYSKLVGVANRWMEVLGINITFPSEHKDLLKECYQAGQKKSTPLILKYGVGGFNTLHQDLYGDIYFPLQAALFLNEPGTEYSGGEFCTYTANSEGTIPGYSVKTREGGYDHFHHQLSSCKREEWLLQDKYEAWRK